MVRRLAFVAGVLALSAFPAWAQSGVEAGGLAECGLEPPGTVVWPSVPLQKPEELPYAPASPFISRQSRSPFAHFGSPSSRLRSGALSGKTVYVSAGHGFTWTQTLNAWATQRGNTNNVVEDLVSAETMTQFLIPLLQNAGAYVIPIRESDLNTQLKVVDNADADYSESGPAGTFSDSILNAYGAPPSPLVNGTNPFDLGGNRLMEAKVGATADASATWVIDVPADGAYNLYVSYTQFSYRVPDAHFVVKHAGGEAHFRIDQRRHGRTWVLLGRFFFRKGKNAAKGAVVALNDSSVQGNVSLDAVRIGGGIGLVAGNDNGTVRPTSTRPRFEESARTSAQYLGAPASVYDNPNLADRDDDVGARSRFAAWDHETGEDSVYVAWHTNACGSTCTARGTDTYVYGINPPDGTYQFSGTAGSDTLAQAVHGEVIRDLRNGFDPFENDGTQWKDRGIHSAYFGELNPSNNPETPAILIEVAFHQTPADAEALKEPLFRYTAARAIAQGIMKFFAQKNGTALTLPPEPPVQVAARNVGSGKVRVSWAAAAVDASDLGGGAADGFRVYQSDDGFAWDDGADVTGTFFELTLPEDQVKYFRVAATNAGGESFPSEVVGVRVPKAGGLAPVLVVNGFDRLDKGMGRTENLSAWSLGSPLRVFIERMNDGTYVRRHGFALAQNGVAFDSATHLAALDLSPYALVDWFAGRGESSATQLGASAQQALRTYVESGGRLILSGSNVASGLSAAGGTDQQFLSQILGARVGAGQGSASFEGVPGSAFDGVSAVLLDDGLRGAYPAGTPDVLSPGTGAALAAWTGTSDIAAVRTDGAGKVAFLSFPFEAVRSEASRVDLMARLLTSLQVPTDPVPYDGGVPEEDAGTPDAGTPSADAGAEPLDPLVFPPLTATYPSVSGGCGCMADGGAGMAVFALAAFAAMARGRKKRS